MIITNDFLSSLDLTEKVKAEFELKDKKFVYLNKASLVNTTEEDFVADEDNKIFTSDLTSDEAYEVGSYPAVVSNIPRIKIGSKVGQHALNRIAKNNNEGEFLDDWKATLVKSLVTAYKTRLNQMAALWMRGGGSHGGIVFSTNTLKGVHTTGSDKDSIKTQIEMMSVVYKAKFDTITMSSSLMVKLFDTGKASEVRKLVKSAYGLKLEIDDATYFERGINGNRVECRYIPDNILVLSKKVTEADFHIANFPIAEGISGSEIYSPIAYFTSESEDTPPSVTAWMNGQCIPVLKDKTAFSTITFE